MEQRTGVDKAKRQCWECLKRRLVCDLTLPHCLKCQKKGKECPGYHERKPLQWVELGSATSRRRRKGRTTAPADDVNAPSSTSPENTVPDINMILSALASDYRSPDLASRDRIQLVVSEGLRAEAQKILRQETDPLAGLERMLRHMELEDLPRYNLQSEACEVVQAVQYFNTRMYPDLQVANDMAPNPHIMYFPVAALHLLPPSVHHIIVCLSLNHFIHALPPGQAKPLVAGNQSRMLQHRGAAIRELNGNINKEKTRCSDGTITSVLMLLCAEIQQQSPTRWRTHSYGLMQLFELRGGMMKLYENVSPLRPCIVIFTLITNVTNCTSPAADQLVLNPSLERQLADVTAMYEEMFPHCLCPPSLYLDTVRISHLRHKASKLHPQDEAFGDLAVTALELLARIESFSPEDWAQPGAKYDDWLTIGTAHKSAIAVYCIMSLQSLGLLPKTKAMNQKRSAYGDSLLTLLKVAFASRPLKRFIAWPMVAAGAEAAYRGTDDRTWIEETLTAMGQYTGTNCPSRFRAILRRYWQKENPGWDECFAEPYAFCF